MRLHHAAAETGARIVLLGDGPIPPGGEGLVQLVLDQPTAAATGDRFILRDTTAQRTIGGGNSSICALPRANAAHPNGWLSWRPCARRAASGFSALLEQPPFFVDLSAFARDRALSAEDTSALLESCGALKLQTASAVLAMSQPHVAHSEARLLGALETFHSAHPDLPGIGLEPLRMQLQRRLPTPGFLSFLQNIAKSEEIALDGAWVRLSKHSVRLTDADERLWGKNGPAAWGTRPFSSAAGSRYGRCARRSRR